MYGFTTTPIEAGIWNAFIGAQKVIVQGLSDVHLPRFCLVFSITFLFYRFFIQLASRHHPGTLIKDGLMQLIIIYIGYTAATNLSGILTLSDLSGKDWATMQGVASSENGTVNSLANGSAQGLLAYTMLQGAINGLSHFATDLATKAGGTEEEYRMSPNYAFKAMIEATAAKIDDPSLATNLEKLANNCADTKWGAVVGAAGKLKEFLRMDDPDCAALYEKTEIDIKTWADNKATGYDKYSAFWAPIGGKNTYENALIANALSHYSKQNMEETDGLRNHQEALLDSTGRDKSLWVGINKSASIPGILQNVNTMTGGILSSDSYITEDQADELAVTYDKALTVLPSIMGYCHGALAILFILAAYGMIFCSFSYFKSWLIASSMMALYQPLASIAYSVSTRFINNGTVIEQYKEMAKDPLVLGASDYIASHVSMIQIGYFGFQIAIILIFAGAGMTSFARSTATGLGSAWGSLMSSSGAGVFGRAASMMKSAKKK